MTRLAFAEIALVVGILVVAAFTLPTLMEHAFPLCFPASAAGEMRIRVDGGPVSVIHYPAEPARCYSRKTGRHLP